MIFSRLRLSLRLQRTLHLWPLARRTILERPLGSNFEWSSASRLKTYVRDSQ
jgi:hypothetical protein